MADHTTLAAETQRLRVESEACWLAWHRLVCRLDSPQDARQAAWDRYAAAWRAYLEAARAEAQEAAEAVAGRTQNDAVY